ncbi:hypothetical protein HELRODRAFT_103740 [Helobdella robusta]|uniref:Disease resistance R13L4/SHOC-2-like LRR domain-containing protein n=1 Tax=Helobdella robusta TaxID=6412 RepID=T1EDH1_HELRO|nr:hypothetical protein HELRODRAFT_103740 [Helobdella robusta]ESN92537.1 hypothetical protein HELRODRAFT_103740 [Helobdella robusta]
MAEGGKTYLYPRNKRDDDDNDSSRNNQLPKSWSPPSTTTTTDVHYSTLLAEMEPYFHRENTEDFSYADLDCIPAFLLERAHEVINLHLEYNLLNQLSTELGTFKNLVHLDVSNNRISKISDEICKLNYLRSFICRNNNLKVESIPKDFGLMKSLMLLNVSGNSFNEVPVQFTEISTLRSLYLGANLIVNVPKEIGDLKRLEILYLGGNRLKSIPAEVGSMNSLVSLVLSDNQLAQLPNSLARLKNLQSLSLHNNRLSTLPPELIHLNLIELSLRNNPLVVRFVQDLTYEPPSLKELSGRIIKIKNISYGRFDLPANLIDYLNSGSQCVNPKCKGVYFSSCIEHIKFVDFCGKYRLPLLQYLCSPKCTSTPLVPYSSEESDDSTDEDALKLLPVVSKKIQKVLLG